MLRKLFYQNWYLKK